MVGTIQRAAGRISAVAEWVAIIGLFGATALILAQTIVREIFQVGFPWIDEAARYCGLTIIFMAAPMLLMRNEHVKVDMFLDRMPPALRRRVEIANDIMMVLFAGLFLYGGWLFLQRASRFVTPAIGMPNLIFYLPAIIGMILLSLVAVARLIVTLRSSPLKDDVR